MGEDSAVLDRFHAGDLGDVGLEILLDAHPQGHIRGRTTNTGAVHPDLDDASIGDLDKLDIAPVVLYRRSNTIDDHRDPLGERAVANISSGAAGTVAIDWIAALRNTNHAG